MRRIDIDLTNTDSIDSAISEVKKYVQRLDEKCKQLCERLAEIGSDVLRATYAVAPYAGTNDISVVMEPLENGYRLSAMGTALGFIEFGTGVGDPLGEYAGMVGAPGHGTYGKGQGAHPPWTYVGDPGDLGTVIATTARGAVVQTYGNPPADAFPNAVEAMQQNFIQIASEVFER